MREKSLRLTRSLVNVMENDKYDMEARSFGSYMLLYSTDSAKCVYIECMKCQSNKLAGGFVNCNLYRKSQLVN